MDQIYPSLASKILAAVFEGCLVEDTPFIQKREKMIDVKADWGARQESERSAKRNKLVNKWGNKRRSHSPAGRRMHRKLGRFNSKNTGISASDHISLE